MKHWITAFVLLAAVSDARSFVENFYQRYVTKHLSDESVLAMKPPVLAPALQRALKEDLEASAKNADEIVGLDFDPFLNTQDPCERYELGNVTMHGADHASVEIFSVCEGKRAKKPDVIAEVVLANGGWQFENFRYPDSHEDLLSVLKKLKLERTTAPGKRR